MNLQDQVCTLEQAKRLKELGVKQDGRDQWIDFVKDFVGSGPYLSTFERYKTGGNVITYSAFNVAELGEMLPFENEVNKAFFYSGFNTDLGVWECQHVGWRRGELHDRKLLHKVTGNSEAQARAEMLIYLIENNLHEEFKNR